MSNRRETIIVDPLHYFTTSLITPPLALELFAEIYDEQLHD